MRKYFYLLLVIPFFACNLPTEKEKLDYYKYSGPIQGTTFTITYEWKEDLAPQIDSLLSSFNSSLSNYDPNSNISKINNNQTSEMDDLTRRMIETSLYVYEETDGAFDITVAPIVNAWGFGWVRDENLILPDSTKIDSLLKYVGSDKISNTGNILHKDYLNTSIVTNAIAQGLSVDYVSDFFFDLGLENFLVEIGGEIYCYGQNFEGNPWRIGIDKPFDGSNTENRVNQIIINLSGKAIATSGNYRKFIENGNIKIGHSIDPRTGYYAENSLLSATVIGENCMKCDAFATAFMVSGLEKSIEIIEEIDKYEAYFIYLDDEDNIVSVASSGFDDLISK